MRKSYRQHISKVQIFLFDMNAVLLYFLFIEDWKKSLTN